MEVQRDATVRDWSDLPLDALSSVFAKLGAVEVLMGAGLVCHSWLRVAKAPDLWRFVNMVRHEAVAEKDTDVLCAMAKVAVDRSDGRLEVFTGKRFVTDELLKYIADRSPSLKGLALISCLAVSNEGFTELTTRSPLLQDLVLLDCPNVGGDAYEATARSCPHLRRLVLRKGWYDWRGGAHGIAAMRELRDLFLVGSDITTKELVAVVIDGCLHLERLCVRDCYNVVVDDDLRAKCARVETLILPSVQDRLARLYRDDDDGFEALDCNHDFYDWRTDD